MTISQRTLVSSAAVFTVWINMLGQIQLSCQQQCFQFLREVIYISVVTTLLFFLFVLGRAVVEKRKTQRYQPLDVLFVGMMAIALCFWLFFYVRDIALA